jgi:hypothetical protein
VPSVDEQLTRWRDAGLLDEHTAERIAEFERSRSQPVRPSDRPGVLEAVLYLGVAVVAVGAWVLLAQNWEELRPWARIAALGVPGLLAIAAGFVMRASGEPGIARAGHMSWLVAVGLLAGTSAVIGNQADLDQRDLVLLAGLVATALALTFWVLAASSPQVIGVGAALVVLASGIGSSPDEYNVLIAGIFVSLFGAIAVGFTEAGLVTPRTTARAVFALMTAAGIYFAGLEDQFIVVELLAFVAGACLIVLSVWRGAFIYMVYGVGVVFVALVTFIFRHFADTLGAPLALILSGAILVAAALIVARFGRAHRRRTLA